MSYVLLKTRFFGLHFCYIPFRSIFKHFDLIGRQIYWIQ